MFKEYRQGYYHRNTNVHYIGYHFVWRPKYRLKLFQGKREQLLKRVIFRKCYDLELKIFGLEVMPDHLHLFVGARPEQDPRYLIQQIKGFSSRVLRQRDSYLASLPSLWTRSYFVSTHGHVSSKTIKKYIRNQKVA